MGTTVLSEWLIVVPARLGSQRLPRKPLVDLGGKPLIIRVFQNLAPLVQQGAHVVVATDHEDVMRVCGQFNVPATMTRETHASGTDRCWEVADQFKRDYILNVQGDEPYVNLEDLRHLCRRLMESPNTDLGTLAYEHQDPRTFSNPNAVKVVVARDGHALYFSRASIPVDRDPKPGQVATFQQHIGVYAYRRQALARFCELPEGQLEAREKLEQLRALEAGMRILVVPASQLSHGIDTLADLEAARAHI